MQRAVRLSAVSVEMTLLFCAYCYVLRGAICAAFAGAVCQLLSWLGWCWFVLEERGDEAEDVLGDDFVAGGGGVGAVALHHAGDSEDVLEQEGQQGDVVLLGQKSVGVGELVDVVGAVVGGQGDAGEDDLGAGVLRVLTMWSRLARESCDGQAAEAVVAAELDDDDGGVEGRRVEAIDAVLGGVAADAFVDDAVGVAAGVEVGLEVVGVALAGVGAVAGGEGVAEADDDGAVVVARAGMGGRAPRRSTAGSRLLGGLGCGIGLAAGGRGGLQPLEYREATVGALVHFTKER